MQEPTWEQESPSCEGPVVEPENCKSRRQCDARISGELGSTGGEKPAWATNGEKKVSQGLISWRTCPRGHSHSRKLLFEN